MVVMYGGFSGNPIFMQLLAQRNPGMEVYAAELPMASALGAALVIHPAWNTNPVPRHLVALTRCMAD